jgi:vancomycin resistance protein YoaR
VRDPILSWFTTQFDPIDGRTDNITLAADLISGDEIAPYATYSFNDAVGIRSAARGWKVAPVLLQGRRIDDLGGGVCQVSSTLHAAAIYGGMTIVERRPHSLVPKYISPGFDATVAFPEQCATTGMPCEKLDLKIKNPYATTVKIGTFVEDDGSKKVLTVQLSGLTLPYTVTVSSTKAFIGRGGRRWVRSGKVLSSSYNKMVQPSGDGYFIKSVATYNGDPDREPFTWSSRYPPVDEVWEVGYSRPADAGVPWEKEP